jgi:hypothetical protein
MRRMAASRSGKMPTTSVRRRISRLSRSFGLLDQICRQISLGNAVNASRSSRAAWRWSATLGSLSATAAMRRSYWACTDAASGWS